MFSLDAAVETVRFKSPTYSIAEASKYYSFDVAYPAEYPPESFTKLLVNNGSTAQTNHGIYCVY